MTQWVVIGTSGFVDTSVACGPYLSASAAVAASQELIAKGYNPEICVLYAVDDIDPGGPEKPPSDDEVTLSIPGTLADLLYASPGLLAGPTGRAFLAAPKRGWGDKRYSVRLTATLDVHQDLVAAASWAVDDVGRGDPALLPARRALGRYRNLVGQAVDDARRAGRII